MTISHDEKTPAENPFAKVVERLIRKELHALETRLLEREDRIAANVVARIMPILGEVRAERDSDRFEIDELKRRVSNLEEIVRSRADTEPPPPPSGIQS